MASDGNDEDRNESYVANRHRHLKQNQDDSDEGKWSERCIGFWQKDVNSKDAGEQQICTGINIIRINKKPNNGSKMNLTQTRGIEIIIEEKAIRNDSKRDDDIGTDGMIGYQAPRMTRDKKNQILPEQPTLFENMAENFKERIANINNRFHRYSKDPASASELLDEVKESTLKQVETGKRLLSYLKPSEKLTQMNTFMQHHFEDILNWFGDKGESG
eukprot:gene15246-16820_t